MFFWDFCLTEKCGFARENITAVQILHKPWLFSREAEDGMHSAQRPHASVSVSAEDEQAYYEALAKTQAAFDQLTAGCSLVDANLKLSAAAAAVEAAATATVDEGPAAATGGGAGGGEVSGGGAGLGELDLFVDSLEQPCGTPQDLEPPPIETAQSRKADPSLLSPGDVLARASLHIDEKYGGARMRWLRDTFHECTHALEAAATAPAAPARRRRPSAGSTHGQTTWFVARAARWCARTWPTNATSPLPRRSSRLCEPTRSCTLATARARW